MSAMRWTKLSRPMQRKVAKTAARFGIREASRRHGVSETAVRNACAVWGLAPRSMVPAPISLAQRIASARAILRQLGLTPADLISAESGASVGAGA